MAKRKRPPEPTDPVDIDLDELRAARREAAGEPPKIRFAGQVFTLPVEMPAAVVEALDDDDTVGFAKGLLGKEQWGRFKELGGSRDDIFALASKAHLAYGITLGESSASGDSSALDGESSRPTSNAATE